MSFRGHCKVLWRSPEDIQRKAVFVRTVSPVLTAPVFYNKREGAKPLSSCGPVSNKTAMAPCAADWGHSRPLLTRNKVLLYFSDELTEAQKVTHYSKLHRQSLNPGLSSIKSFPGSGKKASIWIFCLLRLCFGKHIWTFRKWTCSNVILLEYSVIALPHFIFFLLHIWQIKLTLDARSNLSADLCPCSWSWELIAIGYPSKGR